MPVLSPCSSITPEVCRYDPLLRVGPHSSPFNLDRTLLAVFLMSAVRSSSSCLVSEGRPRWVRDYLVPRALPLWACRLGCILTLVRVGGGQDGTVLFFHLLHIL